jgi:putative chitinase
MYGTPAAVVITVGARRVQSRVQSFPEALMLSIDQLRAIMPALKPDRAAALLPFLQGALAEFGIDAPARSAAFLAQVAHESGQFRFMEELWGPTSQQLRYEPVTDLSTALGNTDVGDGKRFKGRGPIQITGRANYRTYGDLLSLDLVADPPRAAAPEVGFRTAGLYWKKNGLNELADRVTDDAFKLITKRINGGLNGLAERRAFYSVAKSVLGVTVAAPSGVSRGRGPTPSGASAEERPFARGAEAIGRFREDEGRTRPAAKKGAPKRKKKAPARAAGKKRPAARRAAAPRKAKASPRRAKKAAGRRSKR